jgi:hypothetical protein
MTMSSSTALDAILTMLFDTITTDTSFDPSKMIDNVSTFGFCLGALTYINPDFFSEISTKNDDVSTSDFNILDSDTSYNPSMIDDVSTSDFDILDSDTPYDFSMIDDVSSSDLSDDVPLLLSKSHDPQGLLLDPQAIRSRFPCSLELMKPLEHVFFHLHDSTLFLANLPEPHRAALIKKNNDCTTLGVSSLMAADDISTFSNLPVLQSRFLQDAAGHDILLGLLLTFPALRTRLFQHAAGDELPLGSFLNHPGLPTNLQTDSSVVSALRSRILQLDVDHDIPLGLFSIIPALRSRFAISDHLLLANLLEFHGADIIQHEQNDCSGTALADSSLVADDGSVIDTSSVPTANPSTGTPFGDSSTTLKNSSPLAGHVSTLSNLPGLQVDEGISIFSNIPRLVLFSPEDPPHVPRNLPAHPPLDPLLEIPSLVPRNLHADPFLEMPPHVPRKLPADPPLDPFFATPPLIEPNSPLVSSPTATAHLCDSSLITDVAMPPAFPTQPMYWNTALPPSTKEPPTCTTASTATAVSITTATLASVTLTVLAPATTTSTATTTDDVTTSASIMTFISGLSSSTLGLTNSAKPALLTAFLLLSTRPSSWCCP